VAVLLRAGFSWKTDDLTRSVPHTATPSHKQDVLFVALYQLLLSVPLLSTPPPWAAAHHCAHTFRAPFSPIV
jgi:hypothetical protein